MDQELSGTGGSGSRKGHKSKGGGGELGDSKQKGQKGSGGA